MDITLKDLSKLKEFSKLKVISGKNGFDHAVGSCGWLDYEFEKILKNKYVYSNFSKNQLVITTFLFAKDNSFLTRDAIRHLIEIDAAGLVINNVFGIKLPDTILRYAETKGFPIFEVAEQPFDMAAFTISIHDYLCDLTKADFGDKEIGALLHSPTTKDEVRNSAYRLNPSFQNHVAAFYLHKESQLGDTEYANIVSSYRSSSSLDHLNALYRYQNGLMYILSGTELASELSEQYIIELITNLIGDSKEYSIGLGNIHHDLGETDSAMQEAIYAAIRNRGQDDLYTRYGDLGSYQAILPLIEHPAMIEYSGRITEPLLEYDAAYNTSLLPTLVNYVSLEADLHALARLMEQHENTLRYRFNQIEKITGRNPIRSGDYEQLALAVKIYISRKLKW